MCRIAAIVSNNLNSLHKVKDMEKAMQHGGPDGEGFLINEQVGYSLSHNRLSIIDLSINANQPMIDIENKIEIIFNGEIYNYKELKADLQNQDYSFLTNSDTEVLIKGFHFWKTDLFNKLRGMYSFILIDKNTNKLFAVRDHAGIKPLYYSNFNNEFIFSSEVKGFKSFDKNWQENKDWKIWFLTYGFLPEPITTLKGVLQVPRGSFLTIDLVSKKSTLSSYVSYTYNNKIDSYKTVVTNTKKLLEQSIKRHLISDVPVGIFLSGGIDSSVLAILAQKQTNSPIETVSIYFDDEKYSEKEYQELIIKQINVKHHLYKITKEEFLSCWDDIYKSLDQPSTDAINTYFICKYAKLNGLKVVLSGLGADELFGGYPSINRSLQFNKYKRLAVINKFLPDFIIKSYPNKKFDFLNKNISASEYLLYRGLFTPADVSKILNISEKEVWNVIKNFKFQEDITNLSPQNKATYFETAVYMQSQLLKDSDIQSMWQGIELRVPFLDRDLMEYVNNLDPIIKFNNITNKTKPLLVDAFIDELPNKIWNRPKQGFTFPFEAWFEDMEVFKNSNLVPSWVYNLFKKHKLNFARLWSVFLAYSKNDLNKISKLD